jgi:gamma-tubulin complex component 3
MVSSLADKLLKGCSAVYYEIMRKWVFEGLLEDPFGEFFITDTGENHSDQWNHRFVLKEHDIPAFITRDLARKVFLTGKNLNFIRNQCGDQSFNISMKALKDFETVKLEYGDLKKQEMFLGGAYKKTSKILIQTLVENHGLLEHLMNLKKYMLLAKGDFVQALLDQSEELLSRSSGALHKFHVSGALESAVRATTPSLALEEKLLQNLDVKLLVSNSGEKGWDIFVLDYRVELGDVVITDDCIKKYSRIFMLLWKLKRMERELCRHWQKFSQIRNDRLNIQNALKNCHGLCSEILHFVQQYQRFIYQVIEDGWCRLENVIASECDLDEVKESHNAYLDFILLKINNSGVNMEELRKISTRLGECFKDITTDVLEEVLLDNLSDIKASIQAMLGLN